jgi:glutamine amidotransferase
MCLLTVFSPEAEFNSRRMLNAADNNPDGFGFAILLDSHIARFRSMNYNETADEFQRMREYYPETWAMFHHRFSTGGGETVENCHPFTWAHDERIAIGHNGVLPIPAGKRKSDTRIWTENHLGNLDPTVVDGTQWMQRTEKWLGSSKAVILSAHPETEYGLYILNEHLGHWEDGVWWSNTSYTEARWRSMPQYAVGTFSGITNKAAMQAEQSLLDEEERTLSDDWVTCSGCPAQWQMDREYNNTECPECGSCWICEIPSAHCMCWESAGISYGGSSNEEWFTEQDNVRAIARASLNGKGTE